MTDEVERSPGQNDGLDAYTRLTHSVDRLTPETVRLREMVNKLVIRQRVAKVATIFAMCALAAVLAVGIWVYGNDQRVRDSRRLDLQTSQYAICQNLNAEKAAIITAFSNAAGALNPKPPADATPEVKAQYEATRKNVEVVLSAIRDDVSMEQVDCKNP